jgi:hypothetical protein
MLHFLDVKQFLVLTGNPTTNLIYFLSNDTFLSNDHLCILKHGSNFPIPVSNAKDEKKTLILRYFKRM